MGSPGCYGMSGNVITHRSISNETSEVSPGLFIIAFKCRVFVSTSNPIIAHSESQLLKIRNLSRFLQGIISLQQRSKETQFISIRHTL